MEVVTLRRGKEGKVVATVMDTGNDNDQYVPQKANTSMSTL